MVLQCSAELPHSLVDLKTQIGNISAGTSATREISELFNFFNILNIFTSPRPQRALPSPDSSLASLAMSSNVLHAVDCLLHIAEGSASTTNRRCSICPPCHCGHCLLQCLHPDGVCGCLMVPGSYLGVSGRCLGDFRCHINHKQLKKSCQIKLLPFLPVASNQ